MAKSYSLAFVTIFLLTLGSCQSLEQISIDYLQPANLNFPPQLRKVAIVNNISNAPDNKLIAATENQRRYTAGKPFHGIRQRRSQDCHRITG